MTQRLEIKSGPSKGDLMLSIGGVPNHEIPMPFKVKKIKGHGNTPEERLMIELGQPDRLRLILFGLELKDVTLEIWSVKLRDVIEKGITLVGEYSTKTRDGWLELENPVNTLFLDK